MHHRRDEEEVCEFGKRLSLWRRSEPILLVQEAFSYQPLWNFLLEVVWRVSVTDFGWGGLADHFMPVSHYCIEGMPCGSPEDPPWS